MGYNLVLTRENRPFPGPLMLPLGYGGSLHSIDVAAS